MRPIRRRIRVCRMALGCRSRLKDIGKQAPSLMLSFDFQPLDLAVTAFFAQIQLASAPVLSAILAMSALAGIIAVVSPRWFAILSARASAWVDSGRFLAILDKRVDIDQHVLPYCRVLGAAVLLSVAALIFVLATH
jgi:hypothetical protein